MATDGNVLTDAAATYAALTIVGDRTEVVTRSAAENINYAGARTFDEIFGALKDINKWFVGTSSAGIAGNTSTLLGSLTVNENFTLNSASPTLTVGDGSAAPSVFIVTNAANSGILNFFKGDTTATAGDKRIRHDTGGNLVIESYDGSWNSILAFLGNHVRLPSFADATRGAAGTAGRIIFNTDDGAINVDDGTNWTDAQGTIT